MNIQDWFTTAAVQIALSGHCVDWVTPLNLPVIQSYQRMIKREVSTPLQLIKIRIPAKEMLPNLVKQKGGFPPNFIHSLDSCHMMLTALYCQKQGLTFTSVHDSFWTHACDVDMMNKVLDEFIPQFSCLFYKRLHISTIYTKYLLLHQFT